MFSYLRPHHKRTPSNPTSPADQGHSFEPPLHPNSPLDHGNPHRFQDAETWHSNASSPSLPPVVRVSSAESSLEVSRRRGYEGESRNHWDALRNSTRPPRATLDKPAYSKEGRPESSGNTAISSYTSSQYARPQGGTSHEKSGHHNYGNAADTSNKSIKSGRRPAGIRVPTPPPSGQLVSTFEPVQSKSGKARLNLLNPMSLLARRRTSQGVPQLKPEALLSTRNGNETYDFQIKGNRVHDFSAPRPPRRIVSHNDASDLSNQHHSPNTQGMKEGIPTSPWSGGSHTPVFTEDFEEEQYPAAGPHVRKASDLTDLTMPRPPYAQGVRKYLDPTSVPKVNDVPDPDGHDRQVSTGKSVVDVEPVVPLKNDTEPETRRVSIDPASTPPKPTTPRPAPPSNSKKGRRRNLSEASIRDGITKHMKSTRSTSSRFSFDMIGAAEQERLLEDRHRQRALERKKEHTETDERFDERFDDFDDEFDYDNMMDDDGLEERIPGVNTELEEEDYDVGIYEEPIPGINLDEEEESFKGGDRELASDQNLEGFTFQQISAPISPYSPNVVGTPRDANGQVIGFAMTKESPFLPQGNVNQTPVSPPTALDSFDAHTFGIEKGVQGLGLQGVDISEPVNSDLRLNNPSMESNVFSHRGAPEDDDLYFDDGMIGGHGDADGDGSYEFDESVFDNNDTDEYGRPLKPLSSLPTLYSPPMLTADPSPSLNNHVGTSAPSENDAASPVKLLPMSLAPQPSVARHSNPLASAQDLTQDTLEAYQFALAAAAHQAEASGKFRRESTSSYQPQILQESERTIQLKDEEHETFSPSFDFEDDFDYDDALDDDAIIAAANAEALANDSDGFYGQEFGFYSAPAGQAEYSNGGYFGPRGVEGPTRSKSGRIVDREPNLTPITERSEYSNRNSVMGLSMNRPESLTSPGLAQLAGILSQEDYEGDLSLDALMKLRRGAWGGSQVSLHSSTGSPRSAGLEEGSPVGSIPPWSAGGQTFSAVGQQTVFMRRNSGFSTGASVVSDISLSGGVSQVYGRRNSTGMAMDIGPRSEDGSSPSSPTLTKAFPMDSSTTLPSPVSGSMISRGGSQDTSDKLRKHRYTGSSESISYMKEDDPVVGERWILERRRTAESGEVEVLGREVVSGGRI